MWRPKSRVELLDLIPRGGVLAEIGVLRGDFAAQLLDVARPRRLFLVDPWDADYAWSCDGSPQRLKAEESARHVLSRFRGRPEVCVVRATAEKWWLTLAEGELDAVYLDDDHSLGAVRHNLRAAWRAVCPGGWILGHDYCDGGVLDGVRTAVDEFLQLHHLSLAALTDEMPGIVWGDGQPTGRMVAYNSFALPRVPCLD